MKCSNRVATGYRVSSLGTLAAWLALSGLLASGCSPALYGNLQPRTSEPIAPDRGLLVTEGIEIVYTDEPSDGPSRIIAGEVFDPPEPFPYMPAPKQIGTDTFSDFTGSYGHIGFSGIWSFEGNVQRAVRYIVPGSPADRAGLGGARLLFVRDIDDISTPSSRELLNYTPLHGERLRPGQQVRVSGVRVDAEGRSGYDKTLTAAQGSTAAPVRVHVDGRDDPLYGLLAFFYVYDGAQGSADRVYRLEIPDQYIDRARHGNVSVVYQPYSVTLTHPVTGGPQDWKAVSWALWLSDVPLD